MTAYRLEFSEDPRAFLEAAGAHLEADPVLSTVVATVAVRAAAAGPGAPRPPHPQWWVVVRDEADTIVGIAMRTAPFRPCPLYVLPMPDDAARLLGAALVERGEADAGANGFLPAARLVADVCAQGLGGTVATTMHSRLWELGTLREPTSPGGGPRLAAAADLDLCVAWFVAFHGDADAQAGRVGARDTMAEVFDHAEVGGRIDEGRVWLWEDATGRVVSLTGSNTPSLGVVRVGPVYTPRDHRGHGYASALVAHVARTLREGGSRVCLFTDQDNPTSNKIYAALGFQPQVDAANHSVLTRP